MIFIDSLPKAVSNKRSEKLAEQIKKIASHFEIEKVPFGRTGNNIVYLRKKSSKTS